MCHREVETFACGHEEKHKIPCEAVWDNKSCTTAEEDQRRFFAATCTKCKDSEDETEFIEEELQKFAEQESLNPSAAVPTGIRDPSAPKLYFKRCLVWSKCGRKYTLWSTLDTQEELLISLDLSDRSHPRPSDIERDEDDPEFLPVEGIGNCFDCSAAPFSMIRRMKESGQYDKDDPWGAMSRPEVAEGFSSDGSVASLEDIGRGVIRRHPKQYTQVDAPSAPQSLGTSGGRAGTATVSESEYDVGPSKGKGRDRPDVPIRHPFHKAYVESDASDDEGVPRRFPKKLAQILDSDEEKEESHGFEIDDDKEDEKARHPSRRCRMRPGSAGSVSDDEDEDRQQVSGNEEADGEVPRWGFDTRNDDDEAQDDSDEDSAGSSQSQSSVEDERHGESEKRPDFVSPKQLMDANMHPSLELTRAQFEKIVRATTPEERMLATQSTAEKIQVETWAQFEEKGRGKTPEEPMAVPQSTGRAATQ
ncbi:MAG: hypothetical protein Q9173_000958, partial [Seirophora scorigena]